MSMLKDHTGKTSMMRVTVIVTLVIGSIMSIVGLLFLYLGINGADTVVVSGPAVMGTSGFAKAMQSRSERQGNSYEEHDPDA